MKKKIINGIGCLIAKWILHNCDDGLVIRRKGGARQIIKVFSEPAYRNIIRPAIYKLNKIDYRKSVLLCAREYTGLYTIESITEDSCHVIVKLEKF